MILNIIMAAITGAALTALVAVLLSRRKPKKKKKKDAAPLEFSKKIFLGLSVLVGVLAAFVCIMVWRTEDVSITQALVDNAFALLKVGVVSYFGKSALENRIKLAHFYPKLRDHIMNSNGGDVQ
jgi:peptidoglycan biosynthesis protein MviN/MurJ (putative lipid II flippase)